MSNDYIIKLRDGTTAPFTLAPGEVAIDESGRILYVNTVASGVKAIPLDRMAIATHDDNAADEVYVWREGGIAQHTILSAGGGALYRDARDWRVPGMAPKSIGSSNSTITGLFDINSPMSITRMRCRLLVGSGTVTMAIYNWTGSALGSQIASHTIAATAGANVATASVTLDPGRYASVLTAAAGITVETLVGSLPYHTSDETHAILYSED